MEVDGLIAADDGPGVALQAATRTGKRLTPIMFAAMHGSAETLRVLLEAGKGDTMMVFQADSQGFTALHHAAAAGSVKCVQALIEARSALGLPDKQGCTAADVAETAGHNECAALLRDARARAA
ncbi:hypothetical protein ABPG75_013291 [Micractinium tetrahymenae]